MSKKFKRRFPYAIRQGNRNEDYSRVKQKKAYFIPKKVFACDKCGSTDVHVLNFTEQGDCCIQCVWKYGLKIFSEPINSLRRWQSSDEEN